MSYYLSLPENVYISDTPPTDNSVVWLRINSVPFSIRGPHLLEPRTSANNFSAVSFESTTGFKVYSFDYKPEFMLYNPTTDIWESFVYTDAGLLKSSLDLLTYEIVDNSCYITGRNWDNYSEDFVDLVIPDCVEGYPVVALPAWSLSWWQNLRSVKIPDTIKQIPEGCFEGCGQLERVTLGNSVEALGSYSFASCDSLISMNLPASLRTIGPACFTSSNNLTLDLSSNPFFKLDTFGNLISTAGELILPKYQDGVCKISKAISTINGLDDIRYNINAFYVEPGSLYFSTDNQGVLFNSNKTELFAVPQGLTGDYEVPYGITSITSGCFSGVYITSIKLPSSVTRLGRSAFSYCYELHSVIMEGYLSYVGEWCFESCSELSSFACPGITNVVFEHDLFNNMFRDCSKLPRTTYAGGTYIGSTTNPYFCLEKGSATELHPDTVLILNASGLRGSTTSELVIPASVRYICNCGLMSIAATSVHIVSTDIGINKWAFTSRNTSVTTILCAFGQDSVWASIAPWGATNATIRWNFRQAHSGGSGN